MTTQGLKLQVHTGVLDLEQLKEEWEILLEKSATNTPFQTWEWQWLWWQHFGTGELLVLTVRAHGGDLLGIAPLFGDLDEHGQRCLRFIGGTEISDYLDFVVRRGEEPRFYRAFVDFLIQHPHLWDVIDLHGIPANSPSLDQLGELLPHEAYRQSVAVEDVCPRMELPKGWDEFLAGLGQKNRHEIRRKIKRIKREAGGYQYRVANPFSISEDFETFLELHKKSDTQKSVFMGPKNAAFFREMAASFNQKGWLDLSFLEANGSSLAGLLNFRYGDTVYVYNSGYDPEYSRWSPGWVLISDSIQDAIEKGMARYDFMNGDESYKYAFGAKDFQIYRYLVRREEESSS